MEQWPHQASCYRYILFWLMPYKASISAKQPSLHLQVYNVGAECNQMIGQPLAKQYASMYSQLCISFMTYTCRYWWPVCSSKFRQETLLWHYQLWVCNWGRLVLVCHTVNMTLWGKCGWVNSLCVTFATDQIWRTHQFGSTSLFQCPWWTRHDHTEHVRFTIFDACTDYFHNSSRTDILLISSRYGVVVRKIPTYSLLLDALYPPPACPVSHHFNTPQWPTVSCINPLLIYCSSQFV